MITMRRHVRCKRHLFLLEEDLSLTELRSQWQTAIIRHSCTFSDNTQSGSGIIRHSTGTIVTFHTLASHTVVYNVLRLRERINQSLSLYSDSEAGSQ
jgi:hypothetical protein